MTKGPESAMSVLGPVSKPLQMVRGACLSVALILMKINFFVIHTDPR